MSGLGRAGLIGLGSVLAVAVFTLPAPILVDKIMREFCAVVAIACLTAALAPWKN